MPIRPENDARQQNWMMNRASMPGLRTNADLIIYFDTKAIIDSGVTLLQSSAGAVLTSSKVPASAILSARARENGAAKFIDWPRVQLRSPGEKFILVGTENMW